MTKPSEAGQLIRLLVVDDDEDDYLITRELLAEADGIAADIEWAPGYDEGLRRIIETRHDVYLVDYRLGSRNGLDWLSDAIAAGVRQPIILLTGRGNPDVDHAAMEAGAADYLVKEALDGERLGRSIRYALDRAADALELERSRRQYEGLFLQMPMPMLVYQRDSFRVLAVNDAAIEHYGYSRDEFLGMTTLDLRPEEDREAYLRAVATYPRGLVRAGRWRHRKKDGSEIDVEVISHEVDFNGLSARLVAINDVTGQLQAEAAQRESGLRLRQILADVSDGLVVMGTDGLVRFANQAATRLLSHQSLSLEGRRLPALDGLSEGEEVDLPRLGLPPRRLEVSVSATRWGGDDALIYTLRDISERRETQSRLRLLQRAVESSKSGMVIADARQPDAPVLYVNPAFERMTGYAAWEVLGRNLRFLQGAEREQPELVDLRRALREARECEIVLRNYRKDGSMFWNQLSLAPVREERGEVTHWIGVLNDLTDRRRYEAELAFWASQDPVTGLPRFAAQEDYLRTTLAEAEAQGSRVALFYIDIDRFHTVNETMGHGVGDQALRLIAERLRVQVADIGRLARLAGDEFVVLVPYAAGEFNPQAFAEQIRRRMESPLAVLPYSLYFTCSIGIAEFPENAHSPTDLLNCAEIAATRAKRRGRNTVMAFTNEHAAELRDRMALGGRLRDAIINNELVLYYQPQVSGQNGRITGMEALVRWQTSDIGLLPPARFIRVAEELGLVVQLGRWVLDACCRQLARWLAAGHDDISVSLNVSSQQLLRPTFVEEVREALRAAGVPPRMLEIEITENAVVENVVRMQETVTELKALGVGLVLDDFGAGYSSLTHLKRLPIDKLKIDRSFITDVSTESGEAALARAIIAMGHQLGMGVVAQGVETEAQLGFLRRNHCDHFQGFLFGAAVDAEEAGRQLRHRYLTPAAFASTRPDRTLLLVDDEENVLRSLVRLFRRDGYRILTASSVGQALDLLARNHVQVIVSDQRMPEMNGTEFLSRVKELYPDTVRMILSGYTDLATVTEAINRGAIYRFLTKPWNDQELREHIGEAFRTHAGKHGESM